MAFTEKSQLEKLLVGEQLKSIEFFNINKNYFVFDPECLWVVDAGVELVFKTHKLAMGLNTEQDMFDVINGSIGELVSGVNFHELGATDVNGISHLLGQKIKALDIRWNWFQEYDDDFEPLPEKHFFPEAIYIEFENAASLQLATVQFGIVDQKMVNPNYNPQGRLLISLNNKIDIAEPPEISEEDFSS